MKEMVGGCCVCSDERGWPDNALVYCDGNGCTVAVHQACYGIVAVPAGPWYCRKCEITDRTQKVRCSLCPSRSGALKRADSGGWAHVVCALYIPEVRFGNVTSMEPILLELIPAERYNKTCYICQEAGKLRRANAGACMQCNKSGCKQQFHVTCAQGLGLLCEEAGNYLDNVKYCGYCQHHYSKLKKGSTVTRTPYKPLHDSQSSDSSNEREDGDVSPARPAGESSSRGKPRKTSGTPAAKNTPSRSSSNTPAPSTSDKGAKKSSPVSESGRRGSIAGGEVPSPAQLAPSPQAEQPPQPSTPKASASEVPSQPASSAETPPAQEQASSVSADSQASSTPATVISSTDFLENKHTKKRKAAQGASQPELFSPQAPVLPAPPLVASPTVPPETPMDVDADKAKKAKTDSPVIVTTAAIASPGQQPSPGHRSRPTSVSNIRSPSTGTKSETATQPSLLVSVPLPSTSHDLGLAHHSQQPQSVPIEVQSVPHSLYQLQKQAQAQVAHSQAQPAQGASRLSWGGHSLYDMQQQEPVALHKLPEKRPEPMSAPIRNKKRGPINSGVLTHSPAHPGGPNPGSSSMQLSPGAIATASKMPPPPPMAPPHQYQDSPNDSPGAERSRVHMADAQRIQAANSLAPHMLGNEINLNSATADCLSEQLSAELNPSPPPAPLSRYQSSTSRSSTSSSSGGSQTLEQLLERQWEQGSQYIMERAKNFDIASLLSCLHQLRTENVRLEEQVGNLMQRKETLLAVNARLANPLSTGTAPSPESGRCSRDSSRPPSGMRNDSMGSERSPQLMKPS